MSGISQIYCWFARDVTAAMLVVCWWSEQKHFSPLGTILYFHVNSSRKILLYWPPTHIQHGRLVTWLQTKKMLRWFILYLQRNDDDENNGKSQKKNWFMSKTTAVHVHQVFWYIPWHHDSWCDVLWGTLIYDDEFSFLFLNLDKVLKNLTPGESAFI